MMKLSCLGNSTLVILVSSEVITQKVSGMYWVGLRLIR